MTSPGYDLVLLDLDGTLMNSAPGIVSSIVHTYDHYGVPVPDADTLRRFVGPPITESFLAHGFTAEQLRDVVGTYRADFSVRGMYVNSVFNQITDVLADLREAGVRLAVATSKPEPYARELTARFELDPFLDGVYGASLDEVTRARKGDVIAYALAELDAAQPVPARERTLMVGDRHHDVDGAREHGLACLGVSWGYADEGELVAAGALGVVDSPAELADLILAR
ncbi:5'-nucleotidase [Flavimobilis marinus]|uniref:Phosphoglycolate phosphatase n=1 Tax=Flavimobilis marinus TaxID=285351 RepID=A0A1I2DR75_9MICO|nr:HAD hydrolase-like protein [Flavimobilis marinus]GHG44552.1 5'-nucleotidase [Flavimobilis marinus]SFE82998.1 phosphoglycolate phosphatase [Flavimobilis marinus]